MSTKRDLDAAKDRVVKAAIEAATNRGTPTFLAMCTAVHDLMPLLTNLEGDAPANATDTSIAAAKHRLPPKSTLRRQVLGLLVTQHALTGAGMTTDQVEVRLRRAHTSVSSAMNYLASHLLIEDSGKRAKTRLGRMAIVYRPTDLAHRLVTQEAAG